MSVIDLRERFAGARKAGPIPNPRPGEPSQAGEDSVEMPEADMLRNQASLTAGWPLAALDTVSALLAVGLALVATGEPKASIVVLVAWPLALLSTRRYGNVARRGEARNVGPLLSAATRLCAAFAVLTVVRPSLPVSELVLTTGAVALTTLLGRAVADLLIPSRPEDKPLALVRGSADDIQRLAELAERDASIPFRVGVVQVTDGTASGEWTESRVLVPRSVDTVEAAVRNRVGAVVLMGGQAEPAVAVRRMVWRLEGYGIATSMIPVVADLCAPEVRPLGDTGMPLLSFHARDLGAEVGLSKVVVDKVLAVLGLTLVLPVVMVTSLAVKLSSPGPVLFRQVRVGRNGQPFEMLKFRTMYLDAEERRAELEERNRHSGGTLFKIQDDPRVTSVGRVLRRFSLDELPQLFNVARGQMSLVGPRPPLPNEVANYPVDAHRRFRVRPGLTGLWQVNGRSDLDPDESARLDTHYVEQWSPAMDLRILARTPKAVVSGRGAY